MTNVLDLSCLSVTKRKRKLLMREVAFPVRRFNAIVGQNLVFALCEFRAERGEF